MFANIHLKIFLTTGTVYRNNSNNNFIIFNIIKNENCDNQ